MSRVVVVVVVVVGRKEGHRATLHLQAKSGACADTIAQARWPSSLHTVQALWAGVWIGQR